jgi:putative restriction endonuclease
VPSSAVEGWLDRLSRLRRYQRAGERAPHKPLVLLAALGRFQSTGTSAMRWVTDEASLEDLLSDFGPPRASTAAFPFRRLANDDGVWQLTTADGSSPGDNPASLRRSDAVGALDPALEDDLRGDARLLPALARFLLDDNFEPSLHEDLCRQVGLDLEGAEVALVRQRVAGLKPPRDPEFRIRILRAYERRCAMCGYDGSLAGDTVGLDAAHLRWWSHEGPDEVDNGLCLCSLHHKLLDRGVLGIADNGTVDVSQDFVARSEVGTRMVTDLAGRPLLDPQRGQPAPAEAHVSWHRAQVFRGPPRAA